MVFALMLLLYQEKKTEKKYFLFCFYSLFIFIKVLDLFCSASIRNQYYSIWYLGLELLLTESNMHTNNRIFTENKKKTMLKTSAREIFVVWPTAIVLLQHKQFNYKTLLNALIKE